MRLPYVCPVFLLLLVRLAGAQEYLSVQGGELRFNRQKVFLSGMNVAWHQYGEDFGNGKYVCCSKSSLEGYLEGISASGGNSVRIYLHADGRMTPNFDSNGYVTSGDSGGTLAADLGSFLNKAYSLNIFVIVVLWDGGIVPTTRFLHLLWDDSKLTTYINQALKPLVEALRSKRALGAWEIISVPEGLVYSNRHDAVRCYNTVPLANSGAGWTDRYVPMEKLLRFINRQIQAIKEADHKALVTVGAWSEKSTTDLFSYRNYYSNECLTSAGGGCLGTVDFYSIQAFAWMGIYSPKSPLKVTKNSFSLHKPVIIGGYSQSAGDGRSLVTLASFAYNNGYSGALSWQATGTGQNADSLVTQKTALNALRHNHDQTKGGQVMLSLSNPQPRGNILSVVGKELRLRGMKVFMSGMNLAWYQFGMDFGNGQYDCCTGSTLEDYLRNISASGGNSIRVWLHCDGRATPKFNNLGYAVAGDNSGTLASDLTTFLNKAYSYNMLVFIVLWNGASTPTTNLKNTILSDGKINSYINNVLRPLVQTLKDNRALGGWEVINEPEGILKVNVASPNKCFDTTILAGSGAGWTGAQIPLHRIQRFINWQMQAIKEEDPDALTTVGSWSELSQTDKLANSMNYFSDGCLISAGGKPRGTLSFYQMHTYAKFMNCVPSCQFNPAAPVNVANDHYCLQKPNIIGEVSESGGDGRPITSYMNHAYYSGYSGIWTWQANGGGDDADNFETQQSGLEALKGKNNQTYGGKVGICLNLLGCLSRLPPRRRG